MLSNNVYYRDRPSSSPSFIDILLSIGVISLFLYRAGCASFLSLDYRMYYILIIFSLSCAVFVHLIWV